MYMLQAKLKIQNLQPSVLNDNGAAATICRQANSLYHSNWNLQPSGLKDNGASATIWTTYLPKTRPNHFRHKYVRFTFEHICEHFPKHFQTVAISNLRSSHASVATPTPKACRDLRGGSAVRQLPPSPPSRACICRMSCMSRQCASVRQHEQYETLSAKLLTELRSILLRATLRIGETHRAHYLLTWWLLRAVNSCHPITVLCHQPCMFS